MNNLDDDLRATLRRHAPDPESLRPLAWEPPGAAHRAPTGPRRVLVPAFAAVLVLVFVVAVGAFVVTRDPTSSAPVNPLPSRSATPTPTITRSPSALGGNSKATGTQDVHYRGVTLTVHRSLVLDAWECDSPVEATVVIGAAPTDCDDGPHAGIADAPLVKLVPAESGEGATLRQTARTPVTVNGFKGFTSCETCGDGRFDEGAVHYLPEQKVVLVAEAYGPGTYTDEVFHSLRRTNSKPDGGAGCREQAPPATATASNVPEDPTDPAKLTQARICVYGSADAPGERVLLQSSTVSASTARALATAFDAAAVQPSVSATVSCVPRWGPSEALVSLDYDLSTDLNLTVGFRLIHVRPAAPGCVEVAARGSEIVSATGFGVEDLLDLRS